MSAFMRNASGINVVEASSPLSTSGCATATSNAEMMVVSGLLSSWEASPTNRRCASWPASIRASIAFIVTAAVVYFLIVLPMNKIQERRAAKTAKGEPDPTPKSEDIILLEQIRDLLSEQTGTNPPTQSQPQTS